MQSGDRATGERRTKFFVKTIHSIVATKGARRSSLKELRRNTITITQCVETLERIKRVVSADLLRLSGSLCQ
jgi:hypothetical protein